MTFHVKLLLAILLAGCASLPPAAAQPASEIPGLAVCTELTAADLMVLEDEGTDTCYVTGANFVASTLLDQWVDEAGDNVAFLNVTDVTGNSLVVDTTTLVVDATNNRVGIGTAAPAEELQLTVSADNAGRMRFTESLTTQQWDIGGGSGDTFVILDPADAAEFILTDTGTLTVTGALVSTATTGNSLVVDTDTFVCSATNNRCGIGTASPSYPLHLVAATSPVRLAVETTVVNGGAQVGMKNDAQEWLVATVGVDSDRFGVYDVTGGSLRVFGITPGAPAASLMIDSSGRVGINDATPGYKLAVVGTSGSGYVGVTNATDGDIFEIDSNGDVGIGTNAPAQRLHVKESSAGTITFSNPGAVIESALNTTLYIASPDSQAANVAFSNDSNDIACEVSVNTSVNSLRIVCPATDTDIWLEPDRDVYVQLDTPGTNKLCIQTVGIGTICDYGLNTTAPTTCTVGDTYTDTSPAKCWCSATNTWSVVVGSTCT